jgi:hypothetical protein
MGFGVQRRNKRFATVRAYEDGTMRTVVAVNTAAFLPDLPADRQRNVKGLLLEGAHLQHGKPDQVPVGVDLFHNLVAFGGAEMPGFLLEQDFKEVSLGSLPRRRTIFVSFFEPRDFFLRAESTVFRKKTTGSVFCGFLSAA